MTLLSDEVQLEAALDIIEVRDSRKLCDPIDTQGTQTTPTLSSIQLNK